MILIAHRGNINGPNSNEENKSEYLLNTVQMSYYIELDLWYINNKLYFFHDKDDCVLALKNHIWTYPGKELT
jgi:hypothetical protein